MSYKTGYILIVLFLGACFAEEQIPEERKVYTIAIVIVPHEFHMHGASVTILEYYAKGNNYRLMTGAIPSVVKGEKFTMWYDYNNPKEHYHLMKERPVFLNEEVVYRGVGTILFNVKNSYGIDFEYYVEGKRYHNGQSTGKKINVKKAEKYEIEYWAENPQRAIIYIDKPISDSLLNNYLLKTEVIHGQTSFTTGTIKNPHKDYMFLTYTYIISGKTYEKFQDLGKAVGSYPQLINGAKFEVEYSTENPMKSAIYIDKPIKDTIK